MFFHKKDTHIDEVEKQPKLKEFNTLGFSDILHYAKREIGVDLFVKKSIIETKMKLFCKNRDIDSFKTLHYELKQKKELRQELINLLTVNETYFYREEKQLQEAVDFAETISGSVDMICAPCASGEEVYSLCMMMHEKFGSSKRFTITGIDINSEAIKKANQASYSKRSLHRLSPDIIQKYFLQEGDTYSIKKHLFGSVRFTQANIFESSFASIGKFDILLSRNMLIYFDDDFRVTALERFSKLLKPDGRVFLGHADIVPQNRWLTKHGFGSSCYYFKS